MSNIYGYVRISTRDQNESRQIIALKKFGVPDANIFVDRQSGRDFARPRYMRLLDKLRADDIFVVKSIDRLGRDYAEILEQWRVITKVKRATIVVIDTPLLDTRCAKDTVGTLIADLVLQIMSAFAQIERDLIKQRQAEGILAAKNRGVKFGRPAIERPDNFDEVYKLWKSGKISSRAAGDALGVSYNTFLKWCRNINS